MKSIVVVVVVVVVVLVVVVVIVAETNQVGSEKKSYYLDQVDTRCIQDIHLRNPLAVLL